MPSWNAILKEIQSDPNIDPFRNVRQKYIQKLFQARKRNVIVYYSGWLQKPGIRVDHVLPDKDNFYRVKYL